MQNKKRYNPFNGEKEYFILEENGKKYFCIDNLKLELSKDGYTPKSGLLYNDVLTRESCEGKKVIDLGCGYLGILGIIAYLNSAKHIDSIDYDRNCVEWFGKLIKDNNFSNFNCFESDYFSNVRDHDYDLILSNPPQMPMLVDNFHDSGGIDGRKYILQILKESINYLKDNGQLYMLLFDFLGIERRTNSDQSIVEISKDYGYKSAEIVFQADKIIKPGSVTHENIPHINKVYPLYEFEKVEDEVQKCKIKILKFDK